MEIRRLRKCVAIAASFIRRPITGTDGGLRAALRLLNII